MVPLPLHVRAAATAALAAPGPRPSRGLPQLREAIAAAIGHGVDPEREIVITQGAMQGVNLVLRTALRQGGNVVVPSPGFFFDEMVRRCGGEVRPVESRADDGWAWDPDAIAAAVDGRTRAILFANPANPTGFLPDPQRLRAVLAVAAAHGAVVISDESYERFVYDDAERRFTSILETWDEAAVLVRSFSKSHALGDWRVGYVVAPPGFAHELTLTLEWECLHCAHVPQVVATAALTGPQDWIEAALAPYRAQRDAALAAVAATPGLTARRPDATPFLFVDATAMERARGGAPAAGVLLDAGIPVVPGESFGVPGYVRLPFGGDPAEVARLRTALEGVIAHA